MALEYELIEPTKDADACVIWLHGLGANGNDFVPVVPHLGLSADLNIRFIFPHAPAIPVTCNGGFVMPAWYDILALTEPRQINRQHLQAMQLEINSLIEQQIEHGIEAQRIVVIGFSQGGALAYHTALTFPQRLGGLIALSTYLPQPELLTPAKRLPNQALEIHIAHGEWDEMVTEQAARTALEWLQENQYAVDWSNYKMAHEVCMAEIKQIGRWLTAWL